MTVFLLIVDGLGVYQDGGGLPSTLSRVLGHTRIEQALPNLCSCGLPIAYRGQRNLMFQESVSVGSVEGHREMFGVTTWTAYVAPDEPLPGDVFRHLASRWGREFIGNIQGRGNDVIPSYMKAHKETGAIIVYRGYDSTVVVAGDRSVVETPLLYEMARDVRQRLDALYPLRIKKVIAKPLEGGSPVEALRRDFIAGIDPESVLHRVVNRGWHAVLNRKIAEILCWESGEIIETRADEDCYQYLLHAHRCTNRDTVVCMNLEDFDRYAHAGDSEECWHCLVNFDSFLGRWRRELAAPDWVFVTADHGVRIGGGDLGSAHVREGVPLLCTRGESTFTDIPVHRGFGIIGRFVQDIVTTGAPHFLSAGGSIQPPAGGIDPATLST